MRVVTMDEARSDLERLIQEAMKGAEIVIARGNDLLVRLVPVEPARTERSLGWAKGQVTMAPDFDAPLDDFAIDIDNDLSNCATPGPAGAPRGGAR